MNERFEAYLPSNMGKPHIKDKHDKCPICDYPFNTLVQAEEVAEWLNKNVNDYHRFVLEEYVNSNGIHCFNLWDNEKEDYLRFRPVCYKNNPKKELESYVNWLNSLVEDKDDGV